jgi:hypothetical protein
VSAPAPTPAQVAARVEAIRRKSPGARVIGIRAETPWTAGRPIRAGGEELEVLRTDSTLELRERLSELDGDGKPVVVLTTLAEADLGADVLARLAHGRLFGIVAWQVVRDSFGAREVDPRLAERAWVAEALVEVRPECGYDPVAGGFLDAETAYRALYSGLLGLAGGCSDASVLLGWTLDGEGPDRFRALGEPLRRGLAEVAVERGGELCGSILALVEAGNASLAVPIGLACRALFSAEARRSSALREAAVRLERYLGDRAVPAETGLAWADAAEGLVARRAETGGLAPVRPLLDGADAWLEQVGGASPAVRSDYLPSTFEGALGDCARAIEASIDASPEEGRDGLAEAMERLERHFLARLEPGRLNTVQMAARLLGWLGRGGVGQPSSLAEAVLSYLRDGGHVDRARVELWPGDANAHLARALRRLAAAVTSRREAENERFARLLCGWNEAGGGGGLLGVEEVVSELVAPIAREAPVLVLVIDGMSVAVFAELMADLERGGWTEVRPDGRKTPLGVVACVPTVTELSRASLFAGKLARGGQADEKTAFAGQPALGRPGSGGAKPRLFHKDELREPGGVGLAPEVVAAVSDRDQRVVAAVINAVDDHLDRGDQLRVSWSRETVRPLGRLLEAARAAGRVVVVTSDHGHVLEHDSELAREQEEGGERWRPAQGVPGEGEVLVRGPRVEGLVGHAVIAPWSERLRYRARRNGYHGGASPQEVVVPLAVLVAGDVKLEGWADVPVERPPWWDQPFQAEAGAGVTPRPRPARKRGETGTLFERHDRAAAPERPAWVTALLGSATYRAQVAAAGRQAPGDDRTRAFLEALASRGGKLTVAALARTLGVPALRLPGLIATMMRVLNLDGYPVLQTDDVAETVELNRALLERQFGMGGR